MELAAQATGQPKRKSGAAMMHIEHPILLLLAVPAGLAYRHWFRAAGVRGLLRVKRSKVDSKCSCSRGFGNR